jgi:ABC-2 type transport system permease protein
MNLIGLYTLTRRHIERMLRVPIQTLVTPWISAVLYIFVFGFVVGKKIDLISGVPYIQFVLPGILMMNVISAAFAQSSNAVYFARFIRDIEEILIAPLSHLEMIISYTISGIFRGIIVGAGIFMVAILFDAVAIKSVLLLLIYCTCAAIIFSLLGILVGLWANNFEQLGILNTFVIMPLSFLGGMFYSVSMLPEKFQSFVTWNPFFYLIDGTRFAMVGIGESNVLVGFFLIAFLIIAQGVLVTHLFKIGWRIRT